MKETATEQIGEGLLQAAQSMLVLTVIALFFVTFTLQPFRIPSASMEPTLLVGDFLLVDKQVGAAGPLLPPADLRRGDIIVFHDPVDATKHLVKRIVAVPGDRVRLRAGRVWLNGKMLTEPYAVYRSGGTNLYRDFFPNAPSPDPEVTSAWWIRMRGMVNQGELMIPANSFFVLGDNRNDSLDSRFWGLVPRAAVVGRPFLVYLSLKMRDDDPESEAGPGAIGQEASARRGGVARWDRILRVIH